MTRYLIPYGSRPTDVITLELADISNAVEIMDKAYAELQDYKLAYNVLANVHAGKFEVEG